MPKMNKDFPARLDFFTTDEMRCQLIALGYLMGAGGEYATPARNLLAGAIARHLDRLPASERAQYNEIYKRVLIQEGISESTP